ncbi:hypothetical protein [Carp edema virus]|nr:hypothetical protein [Carp edema virus]
MNSTLLVISNPENQFTIDFILSGYINNTHYSIIVKDIKEESDGRFDLEISDLKNGRGIRLNPTSLTNSFKQKYCKYGNSKIYWFIRFNDNQETVIEKEYVDLERFFSTVFDINDNYYFATDTEFNPTIITPKGIVPKHERIDPTEIFLKVLCNEEELIPIHDYLYIFKSTENGRRSFLWNYNGKPDIPTEKCVKITEKTLFMFSKLNNFIKNDPTIDTDRFPEDAYPRLSLLTRLEVAFGKESTYFCEDLIFDLLLLWTSKIEHERSIFRYSPKIKDWYHEYLKFREMFNDPSTTEFDDLVAPVSFTPKPLH